MPELRRNGRSYSGGSGSSSADNVKYNSETDALDVYQNGVLIGSIPCGFQSSPYLFNEGAVNEALTGGFGASGYTFTNSDGSAGTIVSGTVGDNLAVTNNAVLGTEKAIDLTKYNTLYIQANGINSVSSTYGSIFITTSKALRVSTATIVTNVTQYGSHLIAIDVSGLNGEYYISAQAGGSRSFEVSTMKLE